VHGILVQLPLPNHINEPEVLEAILVEKDVDGFSSANIGNMCLRGGRPPLALPCTPAGCVELLQRSEVEISGKDVVVLGRSNIVGMPVAHMLQSMDATVTVCHSRTADLPGHVKRADILVAAVGAAEYIKGVRAHANPLSHLWTAAFSGALSLFLTYAACSGSRV